MTKSVRLWWAWVGANALGELLGLGTVFALGYALFRSCGEPSTLTGLGWLALAVVLLGALEGAIVGGLQSRVLRLAWPALSSRSWLGATVLGAVVAWVLGMIPSTLGSFQTGAENPAQAAEPAEALVHVFAAGLGAVGGVVLASAQWRVLRRFARAGWWLPANALAWALAMPWIFWLVGATIADGVTVSRFALFLAGLGFAGAIVGAVHGFFLVRFLLPRPPA